ncbi:hypothetical protein [Sphingomonas sp. PAMC 26605]|uniref:hypothetical protein n=1 Tax=Sphingomonas sp. PAMC 26605 TaxID=1112214 RepID=UPI0002FC6F9D|nr:hypothetical protein [Sphingomonas sp. PAMC 26605]
MFNNFSLRKICFYVLLVTIIITLVFNYNRLGLLTAEIGIFILIPTVLFSIDLSLIVLATIFPDLEKCRLCGIDGLLERPVHPLDQVPIIVPLLVASYRDIEAAASCLSENWSMTYEWPVEIILLVDFRDSALAEEKEDIHLQKRLEQTVHSLNQARVKDGLPAARLLYRRRVWNPFERTWMGWERKRGKVVEFLKLTREMPTSFIGDCPAMWVGASTVFVMDIDTRVTGEGLLLLSKTFEQRRAGWERDKRPALMSPVVRTLDRAEEPIQRWLYEPWVFSVNKDWREHTLRDRVFGHDIYNGKALIAVDDFLSLSSAIPDNTILSHDHLEAILGHGCSSPIASVYEPFPASRTSWERRQHRWMRGDFQVLPWLFKGVGEKRVSAITLSMRAAIAHVILDALNPVAIYIVVVRCLFTSWRLGLVIGSLLLLFHRGGTLLAACRIPLFLIKTDRKNGLFNTARFLIANAFMRSLGTLFYLQRDALITFHALIKTSFRLTLPGRKGLLEWYPDDINRPIIARRKLEVLLILISLISFTAGFAGPGVPFAIIAWTIVPIVLNLVPIRRTSIQRPRF